jgi:hypothetical protein
MLSIIVLGCNMITADCAVVTHKPTVQFPTLEMCEAEASLLSGFLELTSPPEVAVKVKCVSWANEPNV